jgi:protein-S-isoprenylcysteine O-methyltransferase Ste14
VNLVDQELVFRLIFGITVISAMSISITHRLRADKIRGVVSTRQENSWIVIPLRAGGLFFFGMVLLIIIYPPAMAWAAISLPLELRWLGAALTILAVPMFYWLFHSLGLNISPIAGTRAQATLVTSGPYRWIRHPLYTFGTMLFLGLGLVAASWPLLMFAPVFFILLALRTPSEEAALIERFGDDYRNYMKRTGRYFPRLFTASAD